MKNSVFNLSDDLVKSGTVSLKTLKRVEMLYMEDNTLTLEQALIKEGVVTEDQIYDLMAKKMHLPLVDLTSYYISDDVAQLIPEQMMEDLGVMPLTIEGNYLLIAMTNPLDYKAIYTLNNYTKRKIKTAICTPTQLKIKHDEIFSVSDKEAVIDEAQEFVQSQMKKTEDTVSTEDQEDIEDQPIIKFVNNMIAEAVRQRVSDIHLEPQEKKLVIRFRVDGKLIKYMDSSKELAPSVTSRIKFISGMNIAEKRIPQDGRIHYNINNQKIDMRVSSLPCVYGEKIVIRITTALGMKLDKKNIGFLPENLEKFDQLLTSSRGIILLSGATGSGKSTTLYTALSELNKDDVNIITVEDPVEANIDGINQVQVNNKADLTFASALRSILRQDPDIIMIGEIRDQETAQIAVQASITGHLVVSTLHTNSSASTISRLEDMGVESYLLADSVKGIIAQRLVRRLCPACKREHLLTEEEKAFMNIPAFRPVKIYEPCGCEKCANTGYKGRIGIYEIMTVTPKLKSLISKCADIEDINKAACDEGMHTLRQSAEKLVLEGVTSFQEMLKTTFEN